MTSENVRRRAAIYTRISRDKTGEGVGVERQEVACRKLAEAHGYEVTHIFPENSVSAYKDVERPKFAELRALIAAGNVERVYVYSTDRLARRTKDLIELVELMKPLGVTVHAVDGQGIDPRSANGVLITTVLGAIAQQESAHKAERIFAAYEHRAVSGKPKTGGRRMFGYERDGKTVVPREAQALQEAASHVIDGTRSLRGICEDWHEAGITATTGARMRPPTLRPILRNPYVAGMSTWNPADADGKRLIANRQIVGKGQWPAILDEATWNRLQQALDRPGRKVNHSGNKPLHLLSGLLLCQCGDPMFYRTRQLKAGGRMAYYGCKKTRRLDPGRTHVSIAAGPEGSEDPADGAEPAVAALIVHRLAQTDIAAAVAAALPSDDSSKALSEALCDRDEAVARQRELEEAYARGEVPLAAFTRTTSLIDDDIAALESRIASLSEAAQTSPLVQLMGVEDMALWWKKADLETKRSIIRSLVTITVAEGRHGAKKFDQNRLRVTWR